MPGPHPLILKRAMSEIFTEYGEKLLRMKVSEIEIGDRVRKEPGNIRPLADSLVANGQIQPILLDGNKLIAGFRRTAAVMYLASENPPRNVAGLEPGEILAVQRNDLDVFQRLLLEFEENFHRKDFAKAEEALAISRIKAHLEENEGRSVTVSRVAELLNYSRGQVGMALVVADAVESEGRRGLLKHGSIAGAYRALQSEKKVEEMMAHADAVEKAAREDGVKLLDYAQFLHNGDALEWVKRIPNETVHFVNFDPPWGIGIDSFDRNEHYGTFDDDAETGIQLAKALIPELYRVMAPDSYMVAWFGIQYYEFLSKEFQKAGFTVNPVPHIWYKTNKHGAQNDPSRTTLNVYEPIFEVRKGSPRMFKQAGINVLPFDMPVKPERQHFAQKSLAILTELIERYSYSNMVVLDPTFGSGAFLVAAQKLGRTFIGCEKDKTYYENAIAWLRRSR